MKQINIKILLSVIQLWLFKAALFANVFAFSGYNLYAQSEFNQSVQTELIESRISQPIFQLKENCQQHSTTPPAITLLINQSFVRWALLNYNDLTEIKYKLNRSRSLYSIENTIIIHFKLPSSSSKKEPSQIFMS